MHKQTLNGWIDDIFILGGGGGPDLPSRCYYVIYLKGPALVLIQEIG